jgi:hypothetical protein
MPFRMTAVAGRIRRIFNKTTFFTLCGATMLQSDFNRALAPAFLHASLLRWCCCRTCVLSVSSSQAKAGICSVLMYYRIL